MGGMGSGARALLTLIKSPGYLAYDAYYLGKTGDILGTLGNIAYEGVSWLAPGALTHLINRYSHQADRYIIREASERFLKSLEDRVNQPRVLKKIESKVGKNEEGLREAA